MNVGVFLFSTPCAAHPADVARKAESLGFESLWMGDQPINPIQKTTPYPLTDDGRIPDFYSNLADPWIGLASAAAVTTTLELGTGVCLVTGRNPILLAKGIATLDHLSEGRVVLGVGPGWLKEEVEILGSHFSRRWLRLRESIEAMRELWTKEEAEYHGRVIDFPAVRCIPQPAQKPYPPVLLNSHGEKGLQRVARWADGWCPLAPGPDVLRENLKILKHLMEETGRDFSALHISVFLGAQDGQPYTDLINQYGDAGAQRVILMLGHEAGSLAFRHMRFFEPDETDGILERLAENSVANLS